MSHETLTVSQLFPIGLAVDPRQLCWDVGTSKAAAGLDSFVKDKVRDGVVAALDMDVLELIATAWAQVDDLADVAAASRRTPGQTTHVFLAKHDVVCENKLKVALEFAGVPAVTDHLRIKLTAKFEGIGMTIDSGCIVALDGGRGAAKAELLYSNAKLMSSSTEWLTLPGSYQLKHPVEISRATPPH